MVHSRDQVSPQGDGYAAPEAEFPSPQTAQETALGPLQATHGNREAGLQAVDLGPQKPFCLQPIH